MSLTSIHHPLQLAGFYACEIPRGTHFFWECQDCREALGAGLVEGSVEPVAENVNALLQLVIRYKDPKNVERMQVLDRMAKGGTSMDNLYYELWQVRFKWVDKQKNRQKWEHRN